MYLNNRVWTPVHIVPSVGADPVLLPGHRSINAGADDDAVAAFLSRNEHVYSSLQTGALGFSTGAQFEEVAVP